MTTITALYGPVADDLGLVEDALEIVTHADFPPLEQMLKAVLSRGGKRMRPAVALLAGGFGKENLDHQVSLAASIELLHTATLVHDDVIDAAHVRRGQPTANAEFDNAASVMLGDYMFANAAELVSRTGNIAVIRLFAQTLKVMATGELNQDVGAYDTASGNLRDYYQRIEGKTASLFATAGSGGAMIAECDRATQDALRRYGRNLGMAFQIVDDILDFSGDEKTLGKPVGADLLSGTLTLPAILLLEDEPEDNPVQRLFAAQDEDARADHLAEALDRIRNSDILDRAATVAQEWHDATLEALTPLPEGAHRSALAEIAAFVTQRTY